MDAKEATFDVPSASAAAAVPVKEATNQGLEALRDISYGSFAGTVGKIVEYPFDTVKVRLQSQPDHLPLQYTGPLDCFRQSLRQGGIGSLYRGVSAPLFGAAAETACLFFAYRIAQDILRSTVYPNHGAEKLSLPALVMAGAMSGCVTSVVLTPIELVKCRMQVPLQSPMDPTLARSGLAAKSLGPLAVIRDVHRREGIKGFWRGQLGTLFRETGGSAAWFGSYEMMTLYFKGKLRDPQTESLPLWQQMSSGALAGMMYNFMFFPADTIKSKIQTGELNTRPTFMNVGKELYKARGLRGLYSGCGITVARSAPSSALIFTIYEALRKTFG